MVSNCNKIYKPVTGKHKCGMSHSCLPGFVRWRVVLPNQFLEFLFVTIFVYKVLIYHLVFSCWNLLFFFLLLSKYIHSSTVLIRITMLIYILSILMHCYNNTTNNASIVYNKYHWEKIVIPLTGSLCRRFILLSAKFLKCFEKLIWLMSSVYFDMLFFSGEVMQIISFY